MGATPHTLRCPRCKKYREWDSARDDYDKVSHLNLVPTGKTKVVGRTTSGVYNVQAVQLRHDGPKPPHLHGGHCGHVFWTTHPDGVRLVFPNRRRTGNATVSIIHGEG